MKTRNITTKSGKEIVENKFEAGDEGVIQYEQVFEGEERLGVNKETNQPFKVKDHLIGILEKGKTENTIVKLTKTQAEYLKKQGSLQGKTIKAVSYTNKFGGQVAVRVS